MITWVTSCSTPETAARVYALYASNITAGTQRDLNIALANELAIIFNRMGIDTQAVLEAAATKWNFLPFRLGLLGDHCIGVDHYYLTTRPRRWAPTRSSSSRIGKSADQ